MNIDPTREKCFACGKALGKREPLLVDTRDDQHVYVGRECARKILAAGEAGYQPPRGGPRLYPLPTTTLPVTVVHAPDGSRQARVIAQCDDVLEAEAFIELLEQVDPDGVHRGDYGIDASEEADAEYQLQRAKGKA